MKLCSNCRFVYYMVMNRQDAPCVGCVGHDKWQTAKPNNGDCLRAMSDEELAEFMNHVACPPGKDSLSCIDEEYAHGRGLYVPPEKCRQCWLGWLRQEAKG